MEKDSPIINVPEELIYKKVLIIKYQAPSSKGLMVVDYNFYMKNIKKFQRRLKDCNIYYMSECIFSPEVEKELKL